VSSRPHFHTDAEFLRHQYDDAEKLRIRMASHELYSESTGRFPEWLLGHVAATAVDRLLDVGCGPGAYHPALAAAAVRITACDSSGGMARDAAMQAANERLDVTAVRAGAETLPYADGAFDVVMANHMLYHVPDIGRALGEAWRVLRPGGRAVFATNAADHSAPLHALHRRAARSLGYEPSRSDAVRFTLDDLALVRSVFPSARVCLRDDAFLFPDAESAVRYYASYIVDAIEDRPADGSHRAPLAERVGASIVEIVRSEGVFRVPKAAGCFVATT
jgi:ubiquinone/menaquinone biosynthesis C-methylase UbiE